MEKSKKFLDDVISILAEVDAASKKDGEDWTLRQLRILRQILDEETNTGTTN